MEVPLRPGGTLLQLSGKRSQHLQACVREDTAEAQLRSGRRCDEERLGLRRREPCQLRAVAAREPVAAGRPAHRFDGHARRDERLHVTVDRAHRHLEVARELLRGQLSAHLQQEEQGDEPRRPHRAATYMTEAGMYMSYGSRMSDERDEQQSELEREERRLERLRLVLVPRPDPWEDEDPEPQQAA